MHLAVAKAVVAREPMPELTFVPQHPQQHQTLTQRVSCVQVHSVLHFNRAWFATGDVCTSARFELRRGEGRSRPLLGRLGRCRQSAEMRGFQG